MNKYYVHFKNKTSQFYDAFSYSLVDDKYLFHKKEDKSDSETFALKSEVIGIDLYQSTGDEATILEA